MDCYTEYATVWIYFVDLKSRHEALEVIRRLQISLPFVPSQLCMQQCTMFIQLSSSACVLLTTNLLAGYLQNK